MEFRISSEEKRTRARKLYFTSFFSGLLIVLLWYGTPSGMQDLNSILAKFAILFLVGATGIQWYKHLKYLGAVETHKIVVEKGRIIFWQSGKASEWELQKIYHITVARKNDRIKSLKIQLKNGRYIRLKGYVDMQELSEMVTGQLPPDSVEEKS